jgi:predicted transposase YbfD/YdcC
MLCGYLDKRPRAAQVFRITRWRDSSEETAYGITSLPAGSASAEKLLEITRKHWSIENSPHHVRDVTFLEDRCRTRSRNKAQALAAFRNVAITLIRQAGFKCVPEGLEYYAENRARAIDAVTRQKTE